MTARDCNRIESRPVRLESPGLGRAMLFPLLSPALCSLFPSWEGSFDEPIKIRCHDLTLLGPGWRDGGVAEAKSVPRCGGRMGDEWGRK